MLNSLVDKIDFNEIDNLYSNEELAKMQERYTMKSEREIHAIITGEENKDEDSEEIELF
jgi:hypothetical protein